MFYPMTLDATQRMLTAFVCILIAGVSATLVSSPLPMARPIAGLGGGVLVAVLFASFAFSPRGLDVEGDEIRVLRRFAPAVRIPLSTVRGVEDGPRGMLIRLVGVGGFFGSYGLFYAKGNGKFQCYATHSTRREGALLLTRTQGMPVLVTPDDPEGFARDVRSRLPAG